MVCSGCPLVFRLASWWCLGGVLMVCSGCLVIVIMLMLMLS